MKKPKKQQKNLLVTTPEGEQLKMSLATFQREYGEDNSAAVAALAPGEAIQIGDDDCVVERLAPGHTQPRSKRRDKRTVHARTAAKQLAKRCKPVKKGASTVEPTEVAALEKLYGHAKKEYHEIGDQLRVAHGNA